MIIDGSWMVAKWRFGCETEWSRRRRCEVERGEGGRGALSQWIDWKSWQLGKFKGIWGDENPFWGGSELHHQTLDYQTINEEILVDFKRENVFERIKKIIEKNAKRIWWWLIKAEATPNNSADSAVGGLAKSVLSRKNRRKSEIALKIKR